MVIKVIRYGAWKKQKQSGSNPRCSVCEGNGTVTFYDTNENEYECECAECSGDGVTGLKIKDYLNEIMQLKNKAETFCNTEIEIKEIDDED